MALSVEGTAALERRGAAGSARETYTPLTARGLLSFTLATLALAATLPRPAMAETPPPTGVHFLDKATYDRIPAELPALAGRFPTRQDLSSWFAAPRDQTEKQASCVGWAIAALKSYQEQVERRWGAAANPFSASFIYNQIKPATPSCSQATFLSRGLQHLVTYGIVTESDFPYDPERCDTRPSEAVSKKALDFRAVYYRRLDRFDDARAHLAAGTPVVVALQLNETFWKLASGTTYDEEPSAQWTGHAVVLVGYDDTKKAFKLINSSGPTWADSGFGWISYNAYAKAVREAYVVGDLFDPFSTELAVGGPSSRGPLPAETFVFHETTEFIGDASVSARTIVFRENSYVRIRNGARLELRAGKAFKRP